MKHKTTGMLLWAMSLATGVFAQGNNTGMGGNEAGYESLAKRVLNIENKSEAVQVFINYAGAFGVDEPHETPSMGFAAKQLRLEIKGTVNNRWFYRFRNRLNKTSAASGWDNFAKATDVMMVGCKLNNKLTVQAGKMTQLWGGYEFDENPLYIYKFSDFNDNISCYTAGVALSYQLHPAHEVAVEVANVYNGSLNEEYGDNAMQYNVEKNTLEPLQKAHAPLMYILNWNGKFFNGLLSTRWSAGYERLVHGKGAQTLMLGQQLNLPRLQWYVDVLYAHQGIDRFGVVSPEVRMGMNTMSNVVMSDVVYQGLVTKANWQFAPQWNLMLKGMLEKAGVDNMPELENYRTAWGTVVSVEYYPIEKQDVRVFLAYIGRKFNYNNAAWLNNHATNRIELGFICRLKCF